MSMTELEIEEHGWTREEWTLPPVMPRELDAITTVGVPLTYYATIYDFKDAWFTYDPLNWEIKPFRRRELYNMIKKRFDLWKEWLPYDSTLTFHQTISDLKKHSDGGIIGLAGPKGSSKSVGGSMMSERVVPEDDFAHIIFKYADIEKKTIGREDIAIVIQVDEDTKATGHDSKNLVVHVNNAFETSRKAELWAICTGVNLNFNGWGDTLDLRLIPFGFNRDFQATRFAAFDKNMDLIGLIVLQRKHLPIRPVYYYDDLGTWATYKARARAFSITVSRKGGVIEAVDAPTQTKHIEEFKLWLTEHRIDKGLDIPSEVKCRRLYRKAELPSKSVGYMREVILWAKDELEEDIPKDPPFPQKKFGDFSKDWEGLRQFIEQWCFKQEPAREEYATATSIWIVPDNPPLSQDDVFDLIDFGANPVKAGTLAREIRKLRKRIQRPNREFTDFTESWVASQLDILGARKVGGQDAPDIILPNGTQIAVKFCVRNDPFYDYTVAPESDGVVVIIIPRRLQFFIIPIKNNVVAEHLQLDNARTRAAGRLVGIEDLVTTTEELIEK